MDAEDHSLQNTENW